MLEKEAFICDHAMTQAGLEQLDFIVENRPVLSLEETDRLPSIVLAFTAEEFGIFDNDIRGRRRSNEELGARRAASEVLRTLTTFHPDRISEIVNGHAPTFLQDSRRLLSENKYYLACVLHIADKTLGELGYFNNIDQHGRWFAEAA